MQPNSNKNQNDKHNSQKNKQKMLIQYQLGFVIHLNFVVHVILLTIINFLVAGIVIGITGQIYPIVKIENFSVFVIAILLYTATEIFIKHVVVRYLYKIILLTFGLLFYLVNLASFWIVNLSLEQISFLNDGTNIFTFTLLFMIVRMLFTTYVRKSKWIQGGFVHGI